MTESDLLRARDIGLFFNLRRLEQYLEDNGYSVPERPDVINRVLGNNDHLEVILVTQRQIDKCLTVLGVEDGYRFVGQAAYRLKEEK